MPCSLVLILQVSQYGVPERNEALHRYMRVIASRVKGAQPSFCLAQAFPTAKCHLSAGAGIHGLPALAFLRSLTTMKLCSVYAIHQIPQHSQVSFWKPLRVGNGSHTWGSNLSQRPLLGGWRRKFWGHSEECPNPWGCSWMTICQGGQGEDPCLRVHQIYSLPPPKCLQLHGSNTRTGSHCPMSPV